MDKLEWKFQTLIRLIIVFVSIGLLIVGSFQFLKYFRDSKVEKIEKTALIIENPKNEDEQLLEFEFDGEIFISDPVDEYKEYFGDLGDEQQIFVQESNPNRVFMTETAKGEGIFSSLLLGWGALLALIVVAERRLLSILQKGKAEYEDD